MHLLFLHNILPATVIQAFCWMLVHSLWQGLVFTIVTGLVMMATNKASAKTRYNAVAVLFFLFIAVCAGTFIKGLYSGGANMAGQPVTEGAAGLTSFIKTLGDYFSTNAPAIVLLWFVVFCAKCVSMAGSVVYSQRVKHRGIHQPGVEWKNRLRQLCRSLGIKKAVRVLESELVKLPVVIGHLKPVIFIPLGLLNNMPAGEVEAMLLHELAHIRRNDYIINFVQVVAENIFFFNPALLWMSSLLREERENCCDDVAIAHTNSKKQFIQALISFKEHSLANAKYMVAFPAKKNQLLHRVTRILQNKNKPLNAAEKLFLMTSFVLLSVLCASMNKGAVVAGVKQPVTNATVVETKLLPKQKMASPVAAPDGKNYPFDKNKDGRKLADKTVAAPGIRTNKPVTVAVYHKVIANKEHEGQAVADDENNTKQDQAPTDDARQEELDRQQALEDQKQALADQKQAEEDRKQALADLAQAERDRKQADLDRKQAEQDKKQADVDRQQTETEKAEDIKSQQQVAPAKKAATHVAKKH